MTTLVTAREVLSLAFTELDQITPEAVNKNKIIAAQERFVRPVFGKLFEAMLDGKYLSFVDEYIKPALAFYVRYVMLPDLSVQVGNMGVQISRTDYSNAASDKQREVLRIQSLSDADNLLDIAVRYVAQNASEFPEYELDKPKKKTSIKGGIVL